MKCISLCISIHAPREGGDSLCAEISGKDLISIHAPREGGDLMVTTTSHLTDKFQSTPPARGATWFDSGSRIHFKISIHAPREGGDVTLVPSLVVKEVFQSTPPARGATAKMHSFICESLINK